jgi:hypothetical protein
MTKRKPNGTPATIAEREAIDFKALDVDFDWTNDAWARTYLPRIRLAMLLLRSDRAKATETMASIVADGLGPDMLEGFCNTKDHLTALVDLVDAALTRAFLVLDGLGYGPENPPPDKREAVQ